MNKYETECDRHDMDQYFDKEKCIYCSLNKEVELVKQFISSSMNNLIYNFSENEKEEMMQLYWSNLRDKLKQFEEEIYPLTELKINKLETTSNNVEKMISGFDPFNPTKINRIGDYNKYYFYNPFIESTIKQFSEIPFSQPISHEIKHSMGAIKPLRTCGECWKVLDEQEDCLCCLINETKSNVAKAIEQENNLSNLMKTYRYAEKHGFNHKRLIQQLGLDYDEEIQKMKMENEEVNAMNSGTLYEIHGKNLDFMSVDEIEEKRKLDYFKAPTNEEIFPKYDVDDRPTDEDKLNDKSNYKYGIESKVQRELEKYQDKLAIKALDEAAQALKSENVASCATCTKCNYKNDYMDFDPNYICYKCKNF